jgi:predicted metal-binding protein
LERYRQKAIELGASKAKIVRVTEIPVEDAVVVKCRIPRCAGFGMCAHCPPHAPKPAEFRDYLQGYDSAVFFVRDLATELLLRDRGDKERRSAYRSIYDIVSRLESTAFYDGHYLAFGLGAGSCRTIFCGPDKACQALDGEACKFALMARPSMEAVGINVYKMTATAGWDVYPIGTKEKKDDAPHAILAGLVVID